jgi:hypothetical protein
MAFTEDEKSAIRNYLGLSELYKDLDARLEGQLTTLSTYAETRVRACLTKLAAVDAKLDSVALNSLDVKSADGATFFGPDQIDALQNYGRTLIGQIATTFLMDVPRDYYGGAAGNGGALSIG